MKLIEDKKYKGIGNCLIHAVKFKLRYGGSIYVVFQKRKFPSFRVRLDGVNYGFTPIDKKSNTFYFVGSTVFK